MSCNFTEGVSLAANVCTILAFGVAAHLWWTWKKQQNYSFTRDKIFEAELATSKAHTSFMQYVNQRYEYMLRDIQSLTVIDPPYYQTIFRDLEHEVTTNLNSYDLALNSLNILDVEFSKEILVNCKIIERQYMHFFDQLSIKDNTEELIKYYWETVVPEMQEKRKKAVDHLSEIRKGI